MLVQRSQPTPFGLSDLAEGPFEALGRRLAAEPEDVLRRVLLGATAAVTTSDDGTRQLELSTTEAQDVIHSSVPLLPLEEAQGRPVRAALEAPTTPARRGQAAAAGRIAAAFVQGLGTGPRPSCQASSTGQDVIWWRR